MKRPSEKDMVYIFLTLFILVQYFLLLFSESVLGFGGYENISYYQSARYLLVTPELLESPLFITLQVPFAQLGYSVARVFNLLVAVVTLILTIRIVKRLYNGKFALLVVALTAFSPVYFKMATSSFPEVLLGFLLVASVYLFVSGRYMLSSLVVSFIPMVIPAGLFILPVFTLGLYLQKSYKSIPLVLSGIFIYSVGALIVYNDFFLLFDTLNAWAEETAGNFTASPVTAVGIVLFVLTLAGLLLGLYDAVGKRRSRNSNLVYFILTAGSVLVYYGVGYWWLNKSQLALERATAALVPFMALISLQAVDFIQRKMKFKALATGFFLVLVTTHILLLFLHSNLLMKAAPGELAMKKAAAYLQYNEQGSQLYCFDPLLAHFLQLNPNSELLADSIPGNGQPAENMDRGDVLVWTSRHVNDIDGILPADLLNDTTLTKVASFSASDASGGLNREDFKVHLFKKEQSKKRGSEVADYYRNVLTFKDYLNDRVKNIEGMKVWELDSTQEYSPAIRMSTGVVIKKNFYEIIAKVKYKALQPIKTAEVLLVCSVEKDGESLSYNAEYLVSPSVTWEELELNVTIPSSVPKSANIAVYLWNKEREHILIDELSAEVRSY